MVEYDELLKEYRALKRKYALMEATLARARQLTFAQDRVKTVLNESLRKELQYFQLVLENITNILLLFDFDGRFAYASNTFLAASGIANFGFINGSHFKDVLKPLISKESLSRFSEAVDKAVMQKNTFSFEEAMDFGLRGMPRTFSILVTPMTNEDGKSTGIMALFNDITEINQALETATRASLAKSEFLANMSHEIRTPINAITGMTAIGKSSANTERKDYCFSRIEGASNHLLGIINDILDMSKIEANKLELSPIEYDFEDMLKRVVNVVSFRMDEKGQKLTVYIDKTIPKILIGDDQRLVQVITNLVGNAIKFTPNGGSVSLDTRFLGEENGVCTLQLAITDTGIGISPEQQARLFTSFQQAESSTTRTFGGTGLGLVISRSIVEMMGGRIWIESKPGKGTTFTFTIQAKRGVEKSADPHMLPCWSNLRILAVDDDMEIVEYFRGVVQALGAYCDIATSGEDALALVEKNGDYHFYFVDWKMPGIDGIQLIQALKTRKVLFGSVAIMFSSANWDTIEEEAKRAGVDAFLTKPLFPSSIADAIIEALNAKQPPMKVEQENSSANFAGNHILLAEDIDINREIVIALLEPMLLKVDCAENGLEAIRMFSEAPEKYDMVFMDVQMPKMDGYEATLNIRALEHPRAKTIPIIAMTANVFREDIEKCRKAGMDDHIGKPLDLDGLLGVLRKHLPEGKPPS